MGLRLVLRVGLGLLLAGAFAWLAFGQLDWRTAAQRLQQLDARALLAALTCLGLGYTIRIWRWWALLRALAPSLPFGHTVGPFLAGMALNNVLPLRAGDVARTVTFSSELRLPPSQLFGTLVIERLCDLLTLLLLLVGGVLLGATGILSTGMLAGVVAIAVLLVLTVAIGGAVGLRAARDCRRPAAAAATPATPVGWRGRGQAGLLRVCEALALVHSPGMAGRLALSSLLAWLCEGAMFAAVAVGLGMELDLGPWLALTTGTLGTLLPGMPGHVGTFDYFAMQGILAFGATEAAAAIFALTVHVLLWAPVTVVGLLALLVLKTKAAPLGERLPAVLPVTRD